MSEQMQKMRAAETARYMRMATSTLAHWRSRGGGPKFSKVGPRLVVYDRSDVDAFLSNRLCHSTAEYRSLDKRVR